MNISLNFDQFLACHAARGGVVGAFARSAGADPLLPSSANYREYADYLRSSGVLSWVGEGFDEAWEEYAKCRFESTVLVTRMGDNSWCVMLDGEDIDYFDMDGAFETVRSTIAKSIATLSGAEVPMKYGFDGEAATFTFPVVGEVTFDPSDLAIDIDMPGYDPKVSDMEIARAICDHISRTTPFCAQFEDDDVLRGIPTERETEHD